MTSPDAGLAPRQLAGYRVLRSLGRDDGAEILLGFREPATVALKCLPADAATWRRAGAVLEAWERARGPQVAELLDVDADDEGIRLIVERLPRGSLAELLERRPRWDAGEVVTLLAPLAEALRRLHGAGVAHGAVSARTILFRESGEPVLSGFGAATVFAPAAPEVVLERQPGVVADRQAIRELAVDLLACVTGARARAAGMLATELASGPLDLVLGVLTSRLFEVAAARPIIFDVTEEGGDASETGVGRLVPIGVPTAETGEFANGSGRHSGRLARREAAGRALGRIVPDAWAQWVLDAVDGSAPIALLRAAVGWWLGWTTRGRRLTLGGAVAVTAVAIALAVLPPVGPGAGAVAAGTPSLGVPAPSDLPAAPATAAPATAAPELLGDDAVSAAVVLVAHRDRCLRTLSTTCLAQVELPGSGALRDDRAVIGAVRQGAELPAPLLDERSGDDQPAATPELVQRLGDSALVRLGPVVPGATRPASVLLVKVEAGWRLRDVITATGPGVG